MRSVRREIRKLITTLAVASLPLPRRADGTQPGWETRFDRAAHQREGGSVRRWQAEPTPVSEFTRMLGADLVKVQVDLAISLSTSSTCFWGIKPEDEPLREGASILNERERAPADRH